MDWEILIHDTYPGHRQKNLAKKHCREVTNVFLNLETYKTALEAGEHPEQLKRYFSFVHDEKRGLFAIDQRPPVKGFQLRLYIYPDMTQKKLYILIIGDKNTQSDDIQVSYKKLEELKNG